MINAAPNTKKTIPCLANSDASLKSSEISAEVIPSILLFAAELGLLLRITPSAIQEDPKRSVNAEASSTQFSTENKHSGIHAKCIAAKLKPTTAMTEQQTSKAILKLF